MNASCQSERRSNDECRQSYRYHGTCRSTGPPRRPGTGRGCGVRAVRISGPGWRWTVSPGTAFPLRFHRLSSRSAFACGPFCAAAHSEPCWWVRGQPRVAEVFGALYSGRGLPHLGPPCPPAELAVSFDGAQLWRPWAEQPEWQAQDVGGFLHTDRRSVPATASHCHELCPLGRCFTGERGSAEL